LRVEQFAKTENYIAEEIHYERYEELKRQREVVGKYEGVYKRNYLLKLKELEALINNISKQDRIIQETEANVVNVRMEIDTISQLIGAQRKRFHSSLLSKKQEKMSNSQQPLEVRSPTPQQGTIYAPGNDKNGPVEND
jgi:hypothetical protein